MIPTKTAFAMWNGGRYVNFGKPVTEKRLIKLARLAYENGIRTFVTSDVYKQGESDLLLKQALEPFPRDSYSIVSLIGHDIYSGKRCEKGIIQRFTDKSLRNEKEYGDYLAKATIRSLKRCSTDYFDLVMLHNPDRTGYTNQNVWDGMARLKSSGLSTQLGIAPGPANGFLLDLLESFETYGHIIDWGLVIFNPFEPWPTQNLLSSAKIHNISLMTRVVECGGIFHDDLDVYHRFSTSDHRMHRPKGWMDEGMVKLSKLKPIAEAYPCTLLQFACLWALSHVGVSSVVPTLIQEDGMPAKSIESKLIELANLPDSIEITDADLNTIDKICNNRSGVSKFSQRYKGAHPLHFGDVKSDRWPVSSELRGVAKRWGVNLTDMANYTQTE